MKEFFTADEHYDHRNIISFCKRPFLDVGHMREELIARHNSRVGHGDITYHLGDMFWRTIRFKEAVAIMSRLNGQHVYVFGNHEEIWESNRDLARCFQATDTRCHITPKDGPKRGIVLDHFAGRVWHWSDKGSWQLYGHSHGELADDPNLLSMDVGVDTNDYYPYSLDEVAKHIGKKLERTRRRVIGGTSQANS